ncbi:MAG: hypothetical protein ACYSU6_00235, partial [Planctomycetota bacterium]
PKRLSQLQREPRRSKGTNSSKWSSPSGSNRGWRLFEDFCDFTDLMIWLADDRRKVGIWNSAVIYS